MLPVNDGNFYSLEVEGKSRANKQQSEANSTGYSNTSRLHVCS